MSESISIKNKHGLNLGAELYRPDGAGKFPFVILLHGFTGSVIEKQLTSLAEALQEAGIGSIGFDASGCGKSEGTWENDYRMSNYVTDIDSVYEYVCDLDWVDTDRIGMWGHSMGGELTAIWGAKHPELKAACICEGPTSMNRDTRAKDYPVWKVEGSDKDSELFGPIHIPAEFFIDAEKYNALDPAPAIKTPTLVVIGLEDNSVTPEDARKVYDALICQKFLLEVPGMEHNYKNQPEILAQVNAKLVEFFKKHL
jgi:uncharacterized protein